MTLLVCSSASGRDDVTISPARRDRHGLRVHTVKSPYESTPTEIRVLLPDRVESNHRYRVIYVLPVEANGESRYGDGLREVRRRDLQNEYHAIFVAPTFSALPWYADHPTKSELRQESYFLQVVVPFIDQTYPTTGKSRDRLLLGFSKSGWGAWSLLLRHPNTFGKAAAWDAPLMMKTIGKFGDRAIFGTQRNFERYQLTRLLRTRTEALRAGTRLILTGFGNFREHHRAMHELLNELGIPHAFHDGPQREHRWNSGWLPEAVKLLVGGE